MCCSESLLLSLTERRILKAQERVWISEAAEPRLALLNDEAGQVLNAPTISAACLGIKSEVIQTCPQSGWVADWTIKGRSREPVIENPKSKMHSETHRVIYWFAVCAPGTMQVHKIHRI